GRACAETDQRRGHRERAERALKPSAVSHCSPPHRMPPLSCIPPCSASGGDGATPADAPHICARLVLENTGVCAFARDERRATLVSRLISWCRARRNPLSGG